MDGNEKNGVVTTGSQQIHRRGGVLHDRNALSTIEEIAARLAPGNVKYDVVDAETGVPLSLNNKCEFAVEFEKSEALKPDERRWMRPYKQENSPSAIRKELLNLRRRNHEYLADIIQEEKENEKKREVQWQLEKNPATKAILREKFKRDRQEARSRIARIAQENEAALALRLAQAKLIR